MLGLFLAAVLLLSSCIAAPPGNSALPTDKGVSATDIYEIRLPYLDSASEGQNSQEFLVRQSLSLQTQTEHIGCNHCC